MKPRSAFEDEAPSIYFKPWSFPDCKQGDFFVPKPDQILI